LPAFLAFTGMHLVRVLTFALLSLAAGSARAQLTTLGAVHLFECLTLGDCGSDDGFGGSVAAGDFNDDGFADLAVGVPGETVNGHPGAGAVHIYYGSRAGIDLDGSDVIFDQETSGIGGSAEDGDGFGAALAAGDFNNDGIQDLAIGIPYEDISDVVDAGAVEILFGSAGGLTASGSRFFDQDTLPSAESAETNDLFGSSLAAGDEHGDGYDWLAIGVPGETQGLFDSQAGVVEVLGSSAGVPLTAMNETQQNLSCDGAVNERESGDFFGTALAFRKRSFGGEWAVGVPGEDFFGRSDVGVVQLDQGGCWSQDSSGVAGSAEQGDTFGRALATGDFNGDGREDIAVGVPGETIEATSEDAAGGINVLYASTTSFDEITTTGNQGFNQDAFLPAEGAEASDLFGRVLTAGDFDGDGIADLAIGAPHDGEAGHSRAGSVGVLYGHPGTGLAADGTQQAFHAGSAGVPGAAVTDGNFAGSLASGDFDGNGVSDLVIGIPGDTNVSSHDGGVTVLYGMDRTIGALGTVQFSGTAITVSEPSTSTAHIALLTRSRSAVLGASVDYARTGGTATPGVDFTLSNGTRTWLAGSSSPKAISFDVLPDTRAEPDETIVLKLSNPSAGTAIGANDTLTITIVDDDVAGSLKFHQAAYTVSEGAGSASIQVDRVGGDASNVSVHFATSNGTAAAGSDYASTATTFIFGAGETSLFISVPITQDTLPEGNETVKLTLSSPGGGGSLASPSTAILTIVDDEDAIFIDGFDGSNAMMKAAAQP